MFSIGLRWPCRRLCTEAASARVCVGVYENKKIPASFRIWSSRASLTSLQKDSPLAEGLARLAEGLARLAEGLVRCAY